MILGKHTFNTFAAKFTNFTNRSSISSILRVLLSRRACTRSYSFCETGTCKLERLRSSSSENGPSLSLPPPNEPFLTRLAILIKHYLQHILLNLMFELQSLGFKHTSFTFLKCSIIPKSCQSTSVTRVHFSAAERHNKRPI